MNPMPGSTVNRKPVLIILSLIGLAYGAYLILDIVGFTSTAEETQGRIIARDSFTFTIQYEVNGQTYQIRQDLPSAKGMSGINRMKLQPGVAATVLYDPSSPQNARWKSNRNWVFPIAILFVSLLAGFGGLFPQVALRSFRQRRDE